MDVADDDNRRVDADDVAILLVQGLCEIAELEEHGFWEPWDGNIVADVNDIVDPIGKERFEKGERALEKSVHQKFWSQMPSILRDVRFQR